jgi:membrane protein implicated in regulation of membrane protease activity
VGLAQGEEAMKPSGWVLLLCFAIGTAIAVALGVWVAPNMKWWAYLLVAFVVAAMLYPQLVEHFSNEKTLDKE